MKYIATIILTLQCLNLAYGGSFDGYSYVELESTITITGYTGSSHDISIPEEISGKPVTHIAELAVTNPEWLNTIIIPDSVLVIGTNAFSGSTGLLEVTIGKNVSSIEDSAFSSCPYLYSILFLGDAPSFGTSVFYETSPTIYYMEGSTGFPASSMAGLTVQSIRKPVLSNLSLDIEINEGSLAISAQAGAKVKIFYSETPDFPQYQTYQVYPNSIAGGEFTWWGDITIGETGVATINFTANGQICFYKAILVIAGGSSPGI